MVAPVGAGIQWHQLDRGLLTAGTQGFNEGIHFLGVLFDPVAHQMGLIDGRERHLLDHQPLGAGILQHIGQLAQGGGRGRL